MSSFQKRPVQTLPEWLEIATRKLTDASKERIRVEIQAHYAESVEAHRENGLSESDAQTAALAELGDARAAARRFRKQHLTERENERLKYSEKSARSITMLIITWSYFGLCVFERLSRRHNALAHYRYAWLDLVFAFVVLIALPTIRFAMVRFGRAGSRGYLALPDPIVSFFLGAYLNDLLRTGPSTYEDWFNVLAALAFLTHYLLHLRLWLKLGKTDSIQSQPPPNTAQA